MSDHNAVKLDPREGHYWIPSHHDGLSLFLRHLGPEDGGRGDRIALYVHGATFPSALSVAHRFDGRSWRDELCAGFHVWGLDFHGFGRLSDPYPGMERPAEGMPPLGRAARMPAARSSRPSVSSPHTTVLHHYFPSTRSSGRCGPVAVKYEESLRFCCFSVTATHNLGSMPSPDIYVQVTVTPHDRQSGRPSDSPQTAIVEVPGTRIETYRELSPYAGEATDEQLAEYLAGEIGPHALARAGFHRSGRWCIDSVALPQRPQEIEARQSDFSYDGMKAWIPTRQSFV